MAMSERPVRMPSKGTIAIVLASLALVLQLVQLGAPSYATKLITGAAIKDGTITGKDVKNGSLRAEDVAGGALPQGPQGVAGPKGDQGPPGPRIVDHVFVPIGTQTFNPLSITVPVGTTVTWFWEAGMSHNVVADDNSFTSGSPVAGPMVYMHRFDSVGVFSYYCAPHGGPGGNGQHGTVIVTAN